MFSNGYFRCSGYFRVLQKRSCSQLGYRQLLPRPFVATKYLGEKNMAFCWVSWVDNHNACAKWPLLYPNKGFSKSTLCKSEGNVNNYVKQHIPKFNYSRDQQPKLSLGSGSKYSNSTSTSDDHWGPYLINRIHALEEKSRWHGYNMLRWGLSGLFMLLTCVYLFRDQLRDNVADEVADVASRSMADENVVLKAHGMTKEVLERLVSEPETISLASEFVIQVLEKEELRKTAVEFASSVINHSDTQAKIQEITWNTVHNILNNDETKHVLLTFIKSLIDDEQTKEACHQLLVTLTKDPAIQEVVSDFFKRVLSSPSLQTEATLLGREVTNNVVLDEEIQRQTGDALWNAVKYGVTPYWFRSK